MSRRLVVNADDLGRYPGITTGVMQAHDGGILTSASLMVLWPSARAAVQAAKERPRLGLGLHVDLGEWAGSGEHWEPIYEVVALEDAERVAAEVRRQLDRFRALVGRNPGHLDSHQHVHVKDPAVTEAVDALGTELGVPVRARDPRIRYSGAFYAGPTDEGHVATDAISPENLVALIEGLENGITEMACHPGVRVPDPLYRHQRDLEVAALCDARVREAVEREGIGLTTFAESL
jgi:predicted glycoside hydrolase/deacetylase ChbG (UPF0249 family)